MNRPRAVLFLIAVAILAIDVHAQLPARDAPAQPTIGMGSISGVVTSAEIPPRPLRSVRVTLSNIGRSMPGRTQATDADGRFTFGDLPVGRFLVSAIKPGYLTMTYGASRPERSGTPIVLAEGQRVMQVTLRLPRVGVISGVVRDQTGEPVPNASVSLLRYSYSDFLGERSLGSPSVGARATTDDRGAYRAWGLPQGDYLVRVDPALGGRGSSLDIQRLTTADVQRAIAAGRGGTVPSPAGNAPAPPLSAFARVTYAPIFHPGSADPAAAATIPLGIGEERDGIDVTMRMVPTARINGRIQMPDGVQPGAIGVTLAPAPTAAGSPVLGQGPTAALNRDGAFEFTGVAPGRYSIVAKTGSTSGRGVASSSPAWWAATDIIVDGQDLDVALELQPPIAVNGRFVFEGTSPSADLTGRRIVLVPPGSGGNLSSGPPGGQVDSQGRFSFTGVIPGAYTVVMLGGNPAGPWGLKASLVNGRDAIDGAIQIRANEHVEWILTYTDHPTELAGTLQDASGRAASDYFVLVFPIDRSRWIMKSARIRHTRPATDGRFSFVGLPPGDYLVAALIDFEPGDATDPSFLASLVPAAVTITIAEGQRVTQDLRLAGGGDR